MRDLETQMVELQGLVVFTGNQGILDSLKSKKALFADLLGTAAKGTLVRSRFLRITEMNVLSHYFFGLEKKQCAKKDFSLSKD